MTSNKRTKNLYLIILKVILVVIVFYFVYQQFSKYWSEIISFELKIDFGLLSLSVLLHLLTFLLFSKVWCILIEAFGFKVKLIHAFKISYISNLGRYIPGKIWPILGMTYLAGQLNISKENAIASWIVALIFTLPSAFLASLVCILITPEVFSDSLIDYMDWTIYLMASIIFIISIFLIATPNKIFSITNIILQKFDRPTISLKIDFRTAIKVYLGYFICWVVFGISFWIFILSISHLDNIPMIPSVGAFIIAYQLGYLAFFAPGGIGVREIVLTTILASFLGPVAASVSIAARIWNMITEITAAVIATFIKLKKNKTQ